MDHEREKGEREGGHEEEGDGEREGMGVESSDLVHKKTPKDHHGEEMK